MIEVQHVTKRYGRVTAVDDVSFRVERGEILGFLGPNGAGKTTTMRILTGYMPATEGRATVAGFDIFTNPIEAKRRTGYLPETPPLYPDMTVREYLDFVARIKGVPASERKQRHERHGTKPRGGHGGRHCASSGTPSARTWSGAHPNPDVLILDELLPVSTRSRSSDGPSSKPQHHTIVSARILPEVAQTCQRWSSSIAGAWCAIR